MKTPSEELFQLIKSLNTQEKVHFKLYALRRKADSNYIKLFDAIDKQKVYDEAQIKKKFKNESFIKNLDKVKTYVNEAILKSLQEYYATDSIDAILGNTIQQIQILVNKRLVGQAEKLIEKSQKLAVEHEKYTFLMMVLWWKFRLMLYGHNMEELNKYVQEGHLQELQYIDKYKNMIEYHQFSAYLTSIVSSADKYDKKVKAELQNMLRQPLLKDPGQAHSSVAKGNYHQVLFIIYASLMDWENAYFHINKVIGLLEQNPILLKGERAEHYLMQINNSLSVFAPLKKMQELNSNFNKAKKFIESLPKKLHSESIYNCYIYVTNNYINANLSMFNMEEVLQQSIELEPLIEKYANKNSYLVFYGNLSFIYFFLEDYHKALQYLNKILTLDKAYTFARPDIIKEMEMLYLIVHYELGNEDILPGLYVSTSRYLKKKGQLGPVEKLILDFFGKTILKADTREEKINAFASLKKELKNHTNKLFEFFDIISWVESKIRNIPLIEIIKEKRKQD